MSEWTRLPWKNNRVTPVPRFRLGEADCCDQLRHGSWYCIEVPVGVAHHTARDNEGSLIYKGNCNGLLVCAGVD